TNAVAALGMNGFNTGDTNADGKLSVGETWNYTASYVVTQADLDGKGGGDGDIDNLATGDTAETDADTATAAALLLYNPTVDIEKYVSKTGGNTDFLNTGMTNTWLDADTAAAGYQNVSTQGAMYFGITVSNTGNISLTDVKITDASTAAIYGGVPKTLFENG